MTSLIYTSTFVLISFSFLLSPVSSSLHHLQPSEGFEQADSSFEEKTRLGSVPPSCHNKCNRCHPCMAVQVATSPSQHHVFEPAAGFNKATITNPPMKVFHPSSDQYTNYKPLGWKCRCGYICHVFRECNRVANTMVKMVPAITDGLRVFDGPPAGVISFLHEDCFGASMSRRCSMNWSIN